MGISCPQLLTKSFFFHPSFPPFLPSLPSSLPSFLPASPLLSFKHLQPGEPLAHRLTRWDAVGGLSRGRMFSSSSCLGDASAGQVGPLALGEL